MYVLHHRIGIFDNGNEENIGTLTAWHASSFRPFSHVARMLKMFIAFFSSNGFVLLLFIDFVFLCDVLLLATVEDP